MSRPRGLRVSYSPKMHKVVMKFEETDWREFAKLAKANGITVTEQIRRLCREAINNDPWKLREQ